MRTNFLQTTNIICRSIFSVLDISIRSIIIAMQGKLNRQWVDNHIRLWTKKILSYVAVKVTVINPQNVMPIPGQATIIMCNHASLYDIPIIYAAFPNLSIRMLAKKEMKKIPFMGKSMQLAGFPFVDRKDRKQAIKDMDNMREIMADDFVMWIAPEGTRSRDGSLAKFKKGGFITAINAQAMIIPVIIKNANKILPAKTLKFSRNQEVFVKVGQPIDASQYAFEQKDELIALVHSTMKNMLDEPINS